MMSVRLRLAAVLLRYALVERKLPKVQTSRLELSCWWTDCDINRHMNNSRYLAFMDTGRWHLMLVSGLWQEMWKRRFAPVAVRVAIDYKRSIKPGCRFELETGLEAVSNKSMTIRQRFFVAGELAADACVVVVYTHMGSTQPVAPMLEACGFHLPAIAEAPSTPS